MAAAVVRGASVWRDGAWHDEDLVLDGGLVIGGPAGAGAAELDAAGLRAVPGFVDLQCNGALGIDVATEPGRLWDLAAALPRWGVTAWLPTIITSPPEIVAAALGALAAGPPPGWRGAVPVGLHLEGPFLSEAKPGAHPVALLRPPSVAAVEGWRRDAGVAMVTLAPELPGAGEVIDVLVAGGVVVSLGHSAASVAEARAAVDRGARAVTHLFNAMAALHHRQPGLAGVALMDDRLHVGLVADGIHLHPLTVALAQRALGERLVLVTDAIAGLGMPPGEHRLGRADVTVGPDGVRLPDGTLAGSNLSMDRAVRNLVAFTGCDLGTAVDAASLAPARLLGAGTRGTLRPGARADVVLLDERLEVVATIVGGEIVHGTLD